MDDDLIRRLADLRDGSDIEDREALASGLQAAMDAIAFLRGPNGPVEQWRSEAELNRQAWLKAQRERDELLTMCRRVIAWCGTRESLVAVREAVEAVVAPYEVAK